MAPLQSMQRPARIRGSLLPMVAAGAAVTAGLRCLGFALSPSVGLHQPNTAAAAHRLRSRHVASARGGAEDDYEYEAAEIIGELKAGQKFNGVVVKIFDFGCFVDFGHTKEGLVPRSKMKDGKVSERVEDLVKEGDGVDVWIVSTDDNKITLSMTPNKIAPFVKRAPPDVSAFEGMSDQEWLPGKVVNVMNFGAFVEVTHPSGGDPQQGLVHITEIKDGFVTTVADEVSFGQEVKVRVISVDLDRQKIGLSMKSVDGGGGGGGKGVTDISGFLDVPDTEWLPGVVRDMTNYGAFVTLSPPAGGPKVDGLVHISQIKEGFIEDPAEELEFDQEVQVRILEVNTDTGRLSLTMKPKAEEPMEMEMET